MNDSVLYDVKLKPIGKNEGQASENIYKSNAIFRQMFSERNAGIYKLGASALAVASGAVAVYFKMKANNAYATYGQTYARSDYNKTNRLDLVSGIFMTLSQLSLAYLAYLFIRE
jgi:hypothetical protein